MPRDLLAEIPKRQPRDLLAGYDIEKATTPIPPAQAGLQGVSTLGITHPEQDTAGQMLRWEAEKKSRLAGIEKNIQAQPEFYKTRKPEDVLSQQIQAERQGQTGEVQQSIVDPMDFAFFIMGGGIPGIIRTGIKSGTKAATAKLLSKSLEAAAVGGAQFPLGTATEAIGSSEIGKKSPELALAFNILANAATIYGWSKAIRQLEMTDTWRKMSIAERGLVTQSAEQLKARVDALKQRGFSDMELRKFYPEYPTQGQFIRKGVTDFQKEFSARSTAEQPIPPKPREAPIQEKAAPIKPYPVYKQKPIDVGPYGEVLRPVEVTLPNGIKFMANGMKEAQKQAKLLQAQPMNVEEAQAPQLREQLPERQPVDLLEGAPEMEKDVIQKALSEGKPVPPEVLKDYPELQGKVEKPTTTPKNIIGKGKSALELKNEEIISGKIDVAAELKSRGFDAVTGNEVEKIIRYEIEDNGAKPPMYGIFRRVYKNGVLSGETLLDESRDKSELKMPTETDFQNATKFGRMKREWEATQRYKQAEEEHNRILGRLQDKTTSIIAEAEAELSKVLKSKKIYGKAMKGEVPENIINPIRESIRNKWVDKVTQAKEEADNWKNNKSAYINQRTKELERATKEAEERKFIEEKQPKLPEAETTLKSEVDKTIGKPVPPIGMSIGAVNRPIEGQPFTFTNPDIEARFQNARGVKKAPLREKAEALVTEAIHKTRTFEHLPSTAEFAPLKHDLLLLAKSKGIASDKTLRAIQGITIKLDDNDYSLFTRKVILDDLNEVAKEGKELPFGFTPESLGMEKSRLDTHISSNQAVTEAIEKRRMYNDALKGTYISAMQDIGFDVSDRMSRENYFRHQVLDYAQIKGMVRGAGNRLRTPTGRGFLKKRMGSELDINTDYIQAEHEVVAQMLHDIQVAKTIKMIDDKYNIAGKVKEQAKLQGIEDWHDAIPEGYRTFQPREGNVFYMADTIPARLAEQLQDGLLKEIGLTEDQVKQVMAVGGKRKEFVIKNEIADTLENMIHRQTGMVEEASRNVLSTWKKWTLVSPRRYLKYNLRNISGDADAAFVGNPKAFLKAPRAIKDLYGVFFHDKAMSKDLQNFFERGGFQSTLQAQEMGDLNQLGMFERLQRVEGTWKELPVKVWQSYWKIARLTTDFRESLLRYAAYLDYDEQLKMNNGIPRNFGASIPEEVMALSNNHDKAFWLANDLLGAYDKVSVFGQALRNHWIPFWSWKEVNFKRYNQFIRNAVNDRKIASMIGKKIGGTVLRSPLISYNIGKLMLKATGLWAMLQAYNYMFHRDEEEKLPMDIKSRPHIIFGRDDDGKILYFSRLGALGDYLAWFGLDAAPQYVDQYFKGKISIKEILQETAKAPVNEFVNGWTPFVKTPVELLTRRSLFPDPFKPSTIRDRGYYVARSLGLENEYKAVMGLPSRGYKDSLALFMAYKNDPLESAYRENMDNKHIFLKKIGKGTEGFWITPRGNALYNLKLAMRYQDQEAAQKYFNQYVSLGGTSKGLAQSIKNMHPLAGLSNKEKEAYFNSLNETDKETLKKAVEFYNKTIVFNVQQ